MKKIITEQEVTLFKGWLFNTEKCLVTVQKYLRDLKKLICFVKER